jgi:dipeptidyl aminopeptidase/acylaminoacyl peptidase
MYKSIWNLVPVFALLSLAWPLHAAPIPISAFARQEEIKNPSLSPDGRYVVFLTPIDGQRAAAVVDLQSPGSASGVLTAKRGANVDLTWCQWANNTRVLCGFTGTELVQGDSFRTTQLAAADADGKNVRILMAGDKFETSQSRDDVLDMTPDEPETVLIQAVEKFVGTGTLITNTSTTPAVYRLNINTGGISKQVNAQPNMWTYATDGAGQVRLASGYVGTRYLYSGRLSGDDAWRSLAKVEAFEQSDGFIPLKVIAGTNRAYATAEYQGHDALWEIDLEDKSPPHLLFSHTEVDITGFYFEEGTGKLLGYRIDTDRPLDRFEDERLATIMRGINKSLPDAYNRSVARSKDFKTHIILSSSDVNAGTYYVYNTETRKLMELSRAYPEIDSRQLGRMRSIEYKAQDGTTIPGYLTTPPNARAEKLPLIVMPHGGPIARDTWEFDFLLQFLVSRGYAVLQMNFRGSSGYGYKWLHAAHQDWGGLTYADIVDGTRWAVSQGIADPNRICIVGWSFGGYAAQLGAVRNSDLYKCSVSIAGLSDLALLYDEQSKYLGDQIARRQLGDNRAKLATDSPARHAQDVRIPMLLVHGTRDAQASIRQSRDMVSALKGAKKQYKYVEIKDADHSLWRASERETMLKEVEAFLATHLGSGSAPKAQ